MITMKNNKIYLLWVLLLQCTMLYAQDLAQRPAFQPGETLTCNFYFNWKFIWVKAGGASLKIRETKFKGQDAIDMTMLSSTNSRADAFFRMRDTLTTVFTPDMKPLYYRKGSAEGKRYYLNEVWYEYPQEGKVLVKQRFCRDNDKPKYKEELVDGQVYDMMSLLAYARTLDFASLKVGERMTFPVASGKRIEPQHLIYRGKTRTKADDGYYYDTIIVSLVKEDDGKEREIINFFVTDDDNHLPILLDLALNFGSAKARISKKEGLLYPLKPSGKH